MTSDLGAKAPKYQQIADELRREIKAGLYQPGERLPAETSLLDRFRSRFPRLALPTLRQAIGLLRAEGLIESRHGIGTFVTENRRLQRRSRHRYGRARADRQLLTAHLRHEITFAGRETVPEHIATAADLDPAAEVVVRRRVLSDRETGQPQELGASYIPIAIASGTYLEKPDVVPQALFLCVEELSGQRYDSVRDTWVARMPTVAESHALRIAATATVVHLVHVARAEDGTVLEVSESVWPADRIEIIDEYSVASEAEDADGMSDI